MSNPTAYELIAAVIDDGLSNTVMDAARLAGCRGGTLVKARETGGAASRTLFGLTMAEEREILFILVPSADKKTVMNAICQTILREPESTAPCFPCPWTLWPGWYRKRQRSKTCAASSLTSFLSPQFPYTASPGGRAASAPIHPGASAPPSGCFPPSLYPGMSA